VTDYQGLRAGGPGRRA